MNCDEKFQQRWEYRKGEVDKKSSTDDNKSNSDNEPTNGKHKLVTDLVLPENDSVIDTPRLQQNDILDRNNGADCPCIGRAKKKIKKSTMKKNVVQNRSRKCSVKENNKSKENLYALQMVELEDLKVFSDSLMNELKVARENMLARMREEMKKLVACRSILGPNKKNASPSNKNEVRSRNGTESGGKPQNNSDVLIERSVKSNASSDVSKFSKAVEVADKHDKILETTNELAVGERLRLYSQTRMVLSDDCDPVVSWPYLALPTVLPKSQLQNHRNNIPSNDHIPAVMPRNNSVSKTNVGRLIDVKNYCHRFPGFQPDRQFRNFSGKDDGGFLGQKASSVIFPTPGDCLQMASNGFPVPLQPGLDNGPKMSNQIYPGNSVRDSINVCWRMNDSRKVLEGSPALSEWLLSSTNSNMHHRTHGERVNETSTPQRGAIYSASLRNEQ